MYYGLLLPIPYNGGTYIKTIKQTVTSTQNGGTNEITASLTNKQKEKFYVKNGQGINAIVKTESVDANGLRQNQINITASESENSVNATIKDGVGIKTHTTTASTDANGLKTNTLAIAYTDGKSNSVAIKDGVGIKSAEQSTSSSISGGLNEYTIKLTDGTTTKIQVYNGAAGKDFRIAKTYTSVAAMKADFSGTSVKTYEFAMIDTGSVQDIDTGKLYCKGTTEWDYIGDLSGAQGIKGETGNGISSITNTQNSDGNIDIKITMTNGTSKTFTVLNGSNVVAGNGISISDRHEISVDKNMLLNFCYPIGSLYWSSKNTNPSTLFGGTWVQVKDKFVLAAGDTYNAGATGGSASVNLTTANLPSHSHTFTPKGTVSSHSHTLNSGNTSTSGTTQTAGVRNVAHSHSYTLRGIYSETNVFDGSFVSKNNPNYINNGSSADTSSVATLSYLYGKTDATTPTFTGTQGTTSSAGNGTAVNTLPPYVVKYCWERTA